MKKDLKSLSSLWTQIENKYNVSLTGKDKLEISRSLYFLGRAINRYQSLLLEGKGDG